MREVSGRNKQQPKRQKSTGCHHRNGNSLSRRKNVDEFWSNLKNGVESISFFTEGELRKAGISEAVLRLPTFIRAGAPLEGLDLFDAGFFNYSAREAEFIDPQQRVFLEVRGGGARNRRRRPGALSGFHRRVRRRRSDPRMVIRSWPTGR